MLARISRLLADRMILGPTRHDIDVPHRSPLRISNGTGHLEVWTQTRKTGATAEPGLLVLNFPGTESRAEDAESLLWASRDDLEVTLWSVNPPGYGNSSGRPSLDNIPGMATAALLAMEEIAAERPILAEGFSLGCVAALYLAAEGLVDGILLRNPPPLRELVSHHTGGRRLGLFSGLIARGIPESIDSLRNAAASKVPAVFVTALQDGVVPASYQRQIIAAYGGAYRVLEQPEAGHATLPTESEMVQLKVLTGWLFDQINREANTVQRTRSPRASEDNRS